jgi:hypothetical protein
MRAGLVRPRYAILLNDACERTPPLALPAGWAGRPRPPASDACRINIARRMPPLCRDLDHRLPLASARRHARQTIDKRPHHFGVQGQCPGWGFRGQGAPDAAPRRRQTSILRLHPGSPQNHRTATASRRVGERLPSYNCILAARMITARLHKKGLWHIVFTKQIVERLA